MALALRGKAGRETPGASEVTVLAAGDGWRVVDVVCTRGPWDHPFEERQGAAAVSLVVAGTFSYWSDAAPSLLSVGALVLMNAGQRYECSHQHGEGDRCLSFQFESELFEDLACDAGAARPAFGCDRLPPLRALAPVTARAALAVQCPGALEEIALELGAAAL